MGDEIKLDEWQRLPFKINECDVALLGGDPERLQKYVSATTEWTDQILLGRTTLDFEDWLKLHYPELILLTLDYEESPQRQIELNPWVFFGLLVAAMSLGLIIGLLV